MKRQRRSEDHTAEALYRQLSILSSSPTDSTVLVFVNDLRDSVGGWLFLGVNFS